MVKKLMESIREQKKNSILAMVTISGEVAFEVIICLLYTSPSPRDYAASRMPSSA